MESPFKTYYSMSVYFKHQKEKHAQLVSVYKEPPYAFISFARNLSQVIADYFKRNPDANGIYDMADDYAQIKTNELCRQLVKLDIPEAYKFICDLLPCEELMNIFTLALVNHNIYKLTMVFRMDDSVEEIPIKNKYVF